MSHFLVWHITFLFVFCFFFLIYIFCAILLSMFTVDILEHSSLEYSLSSHAYVLLAVMQKSELAFYTEKFD